MVVPALTTSNADLGRSGVDVEAVEQLAEAAGRTIASDVGMSLKRDMVERGYMPDSRQIGSRTENYVCDLQVTYTASSAEAMARLRAALETKPIHAMSGSLCAGIEGALPGFTVLGVSPGLRGLSLVVRDNEHAQVMAQVTGEPITVIKPREESRLERFLRPFLS